MEKSPSTPDKEKKSNKRTSVTVPGLVELAAERARAEVRPLALRGLPVVELLRPRKPAETKDDEARQKPGAEKATKLDELPIGDQPETTGKKAADDVAETAWVGSEPEPRSYDSWADEQELLPDDTRNLVSEIIYLKGHQATEEREIPLHSESVGEATSEMPVVPLPEVVAPPARERASETYDYPEMVEPAAVPIVEGGGGGGEVPPIDIPDAGAPYEEPPEGPRMWRAESERGPAEWDPAQAYRDHLQRQAATNESTITKQDVEDAAYYAIRGAQNRGVLAGITFEHLRHRRREKKAEKERKAQAKRLKTTQQQYDRNLQEQSRLQSESERQLAMAGRQLEAAEQRLDAQVPAEKQRPRTPEGQPSQDTPEHLEIPAEHRIQTSAWHSIEVDARTGKAVEDPSFQYGHEYYYERAQETTPAAQRNAAAGGVALTGAVAGQQGTGTPADNTGTGASAQHVPSATTQGPPSATTRQTALRQKKTDDSDVTSAPLWPWLLALAIVFIALIFALR